MKRLKAIMVTVTAIICGTAAYANSTLISLATVPDGPAENRIVVAIITAVVFASSGAAFMASRFPR